MFSRLLGRNNAALQKNNDDFSRPEQEVDNQAESPREIDLKLDHIKVNDVQEENPEEAEIVTKSDNCEECDEETRQQQEEVEEGHSPVKFQSSDISSSSWIISEVNTGLWPDALQDILPSKLMTAFESRVICTKTLDEKMTAATIQREGLLNERVEQLYQHNQNVNHLVLSFADLKDSEVRQKIEKSGLKTNSASERRALHLHRIRSKANLCPESKTKDLDDNDDIVYDYNSIRQSRMEVATRVKSAILNDISERAARQGEHARLVAAEVADAEEAISQITAKKYKERVRRAQVRRQIILDQRKLECGRHANYAESVYLTKRYMESRGAEMIQHGLDAATFRRDVKLEEIRSNARQQNLSSQFRSMCANRLWESKWLNISLKTKASQAFAKNRRDSLMGGLQQRLHEAKMHRREILATHRLNVADETDSKYANAKMRAATYRRKMNLVERSEFIKERAAIIKGRKMAIFTANRRQARKALDNKLNEATMRRNAFIATRRAACSTKNWRVRVVVDRQAEIVAEKASAGLDRVQGKMEAAETRRKSYMFPIFSKLVALRGVRAQQILMDREEYNREILDRKNTFDRMRLATLNQNNMNKASDRLSRTKRAQNNRQFIDSFYKQVISNTTLARQRGAELRRALYQDAVVASASETIDRSLQARERLEFYNEETKELLEIKMNNAEVRRIEALNEKIGTALWFQGKVAVANQLNLERSETLRYNIAEAAANAGLRRSIQYSQRAQKNAMRTLRWSHTNDRQQLVNEARREELEIKVQSATIRHDSQLMHKQEIARCTSNRVSVARIEKRAEDVVDAAILTATMKAMGRNAEDRRAKQLEDVQNRAAFRVSHAKGVAQYQKELQQVRAEVTLEQSKLRMLETTKRRDNLMTQRKLGHSTIDQLQPYAGLVVIGNAIIPSSA